MAESIDVFVNSNDCLEAFVREVESLLSIQTQRESDEYETWYEYHDDHVAMTIAEHDSENDRGINFEDYRYDIQIRAFNLQTEEARKQWREEFARLVFSRLEETQRYPLMMTENLQRKVKESQPTVQAA